MNLQNKTKTLDEMRVLTGSVMANIQANPKFANRFKEELDLGAEAALVADNALQFQTSENQVTSKLKLN